MFAMPRPKKFSLRTNPRQRRCLARAAAICIVCACVVASAASRARAESPRSAANIQSLSAELTAELQLGYRDNVPEFARRSEQLRQAIAAWKASAQSEADRIQMLAWLHEAIRASMPGCTKTLP